MAGDKADQTVHAPRLDQVMIGSKREDRMDPLRLAVQRFFDLREGLSLQDQLAGLHDQHRHFRPGCPAVDHGDLLAGIFFLQHLFCCTGAVITAG